MGTGLIFCLASFLVIDKPDSYFREEQSGMEVICDWLDRNARKNDRIFVGYNNGAFLQHRGYRKVYLDGRAELYTKSVNGKKDVLKEYAARSNGYDRKDPEIWRNTGKWIEDNNFDYLLVNLQVEPFLAGYLVSSPGFELVMETENPYRNRQHLLLFRKKQE